MQVQESSTNERIPATESLIPLELVRVEVPATGASINVIPSSNDQTIQDILYEACLKLSLVPSEHKCKITFKDKRVEYPSANQLFKDFKSVDFISLVSKDGPKREKTVLSKSIVKLEVRDSVESFPLALFSGVKAAVPKIGGSYVTQSSDSSGFKRTASMNAKTKAEGNSLAIDELGTLDRRRSVGDSALSPPSSAATTHDHAVSADAIQTPEITDREYFPIKFKAPAESQTEQTPPTESESASPINQAEILFNVTSAPSIQDQLNSFIPTAEADSFISSDVDSCSNDTNTRSSVVTANTHRTSIASKSSIGDVLKPLIPINAHRNNTYRAARRDSLTNIKIWEIAVSQATLQSKKSPPSSSGSEEEKKAFLIITLPDYKSIAIKAVYDLSMDDILSYVCTKNNLAFEAYTFQLNGTGDTVVEMDRPLSFYTGGAAAAAGGVAGSGGCLAEMFIVPAEKRYRSNVIRENDKDVMVLHLTYGRLQVMSGTPDKLIEKLSDTEDTNSDNTYLDTMLLTFRSFMTTEEFFQRLLGRFYCVLPEDPTAEDIVYFDRTKEPTQIKILQVFLWWIENHWHDFTLSTDLRNQLDDFVDDLKNQTSSVVKTFGKQLLDFINLQTLKYEEMQDYYRVVARRGKAMESMFMEIKPEELGQQLCLHNFKLFRNIHAIEFLNQIWIAKKEDTPYLNFFIERFDKESYWVATEIVSEKNLKKRILILKNFILATQASVKYNNFFSLFSFISGLNLSPVTRLKKTWEGLPDPIKKVYAEIEKLADPSRNMKNYRDLLGKAAPPIVPFLPIYLKDLTFMNDGNPKLVDGLINFDKLRMMGNRVKDIISLAEVDFQFSAKPAIQNFIAMPPVETSLAKLKEMSLLCEKQVAK